MKRAALLSIAMLLAAGCAAPRAAPTLACEGPCATIVDDTRHFREVAAAADPQHPERIYAAAVNVTLTQAGPRSDTWTYASTDGGRTWKAAYLPLGPQYALGASGDPAMLVLPGGTVLLIVLGGLGTPQQGDGRDLLALRSADGLTWGAPVTIEAGGPHIGASAPTPLTDNDGPQVAIGANGALLVTWAYFDGTDLSNPAPPISIFASTSRDGGLTWSPPATVARAPHLDDSSPAVLSSGFAVSFITGPHPPGEVVDTSVHVATSNDGTTWEDTILANGTSSHWPTLVRDGNALTLAYTRYQNATGDDVIVRSSQDGGASWGAERVAASGWNASRPAQVVRPAGGGAIWIAGYDTARAARVDLARADGSNATLIVDRGPHGVGDINWFGEYVGVAPFPGGAVIVSMQGAQDAIHLVASRVVERS